MATVKYCPNCGFSEEDFEFDGCPQCGAQLMVRQTDGDITQTVGSDNSRQHDSKVDIGMGAAVNGSVTSNTTTVDNSTSNVTNNVTNIIKEKSDEEKHADNVKVYSRRCRALCNDGLLTKDGEKELEVLKSELGIFPDEAWAILSDAKRHSKHLRTELDANGQMRIKQTVNIINGNHKDALLSELNSLRKWKQEYDVDELDLLYYQLFAILTPKQYVSELRETAEPDKWQTYWAVVAYQLVGLPSEADGCLAHLNAWDSIFPPQNKLLMTAVWALMKNDESTAREAFNAVSVGYTDGLKPLATALKDLLDMDWDRELATLPATHQFYYDTLFMDYTALCQRLAVERRKEREAEEEQRRRKQQEVDEIERQRQRELEAVKAEAARVANEARLAEEQKAAEQARAQAAEEERLRQEAERQRLDAERRKAEAERAKERAEWWHRNLRWFIIATGAIVIAVASFFLYRCCENKRQHEIAVADSIRQDSIAAANRQEQLDEKVAEFERLMNQPLSLDNARHSIVESRRILQQMLQMKSEYPELGGLSYQEIVNEYNNRVDAAIDSVRSAKNDPNCLIDKKELNNEISSIDRLHYKLL
jgi:hypothetical protein